MKKVLACMLIAGLMVTGCTQTPAEETPKEPVTTETPVTATPSETEATTPEETTGRELPAKPIRTFTELPESLFIGESHIAINADGSASFKIYSKAPEDKEAFITSMKESADKNDDLTFVGSEDREDGIILELMYSSIEAMQARGIIGGYSDFSELFGKDYGPEYTDLADRQIIYDLAKENYATAEDLKGLENAKVIEFAPMKDVFITVPGEIKMANSAFALIKGTSIFAETQGPISLIYIPTEE